LEILFELAEPAV
jgi:hypothetical protein